jgi:phosphosulfolactate synthase
MVIDPVTSLVLERYSEYIDIIKLLETTMWSPDGAIKQNIRQYKDYGINIQIGGIPYEIARASGKEEEFLSEAKNLGVDILEYETHALKPSKDEVKQGVDELKSRGFRVVGEVGAKWAYRDTTRYERDFIDVQKTIDAFALFLEAGCEKTYWEGLIVQNLIGKHMENKVGQKQLLEVARTIGEEHIVFELWGPSMTVQQPAKGWAWLVNQFGPDVNIGNVYSEGVRILESVRRGTFYEWDHPYIRWLAEGKPTRNWWQIDSPPYDVYVDKYGR